MPELMTCYQLTAFGARLSAATTPVPQPTGTEVVLKVVGAGVCHSDIHVCDGHFDLGQGRTLPFNSLQLPLTLGHETSGEVVAVGPEASGAALGDRVLAFSWIGCGECDVCRGGDEHLCARGRALGLNRNGGYADYMIVPHSRYLIDLGALDPLAAAPLGCSGLTTYSALRKFGAALGQAPLVIIGAGGLGLMATGLLKMLGALAPVVVEVDPAKRDAALAAGAIAAIDPRLPDAAKQIRRLLGQPVRAVLDLVGSGETAAFGTGLLGMGGTLIVVGLMGGDVNLSVPLFPLKSMTVQGSYLGSLSELRDLLALVTEHGLPPMPIRRRPLSEVQAALDELSRGQVIGRTVLVP